MLNKLLRITRPLPLRQGGLLSILILLLSLTMMLPGDSSGADRPHGLPPADDATYIPQLGGLLNKTLRNHYGQEKELAECIVLRGSTVKEGKVSVPAGGLFYASSTSLDAKPLRSDPFLILGETSYLLSLKTGQMTKQDVSLKKRDKALLDERGYRLWFDYSTDHYGKPYGEFAVMAPSGGWQSELPVSSSFPEPEQVRALKLKEGINPQQEPFFLTSAYSYGATKLVTKKLTHDDAVFSEVKYPIIQEAVFSLDRPYVVGIQQESYRWWRNKRIYAFRKENGILVEVRNWTGSKVLASKLLQPVTQQEYKVTDQEKMSLTDFDLDMHIELVVDPDLFKGSDFAPWANDVPYGWTKGTISFVIYHDLVKLKDGEPWPRDNRYTVGLEAESMTGMLKRVVLENKEPFELTNEKDSYAGPISMSDYWDRRYFSVVVGKIEGDVVKNCYVRDSWFRRTDNLILWKEGRENMDFFVGMSELVVSVMEDTFLNRLADPTYGVPVVKSKFSSYPAAIASAKGFAPDPDCAFVPKMKGLTRKFVETRKGERLTSADAIVIRGSYVDYRKGKIIIPPAGLYYTTRSGEKRAAAGRRGDLHPREKGLPPEHGKLSRREERHRDGLLEASAHGGRKPPVLAGCSPGRWKQDGPVSGIATALGTAGGPGADHQVFRQRLRGGHAFGSGTLELRTDLRRQVRSGSDLLTPRHLCRGGDVCDSPLGEPGCCGDCRDGQPRDGLLHDFL